MTKLDEDLVDAQLQRVLAGYPQVRPGADFRERLALRVQSEGPVRKTRRAMWIMRAYWAGMVIVSSLVLQAMSTNPSVVEGSVAIGFGAVALVFVLPVVMLGRGTFSSLLLRTIGDGQISRLE